MEWRHDARLQRDIMTLNLCTEMVTNKMRSYYDNAVSTEKNLQSITTISNEKRTQIRMFNVCDFSLYFTEPWSWTTTWWRRKRGTSFLEKTARKYKS